MGLLNKFLTFLNDNSKEKKHSKSIENYSENRVKVLKKLKKKYEIDKINYNFLEEQKKLVNLFPKYTGKEHCLHCGAIFNVLFYIKGGTFYNNHGDYSPVLFDCLKLECPKCKVSIMLPCKDSDISDKCLENNFKTIKNYFEKIVDDETLNYENYLPHEGGDV